MVLKSTTYQDFPKRNHNIKHSVLWTTWSVAKSTGIYFCSFTANHGNCSSSFFPVLQFPYFWTNEPIKISLKVVSHVVSAHQNRDTVQTRSYWTSDRKHGFLKTNCCIYCVLLWKGISWYVQRTHRGMSSERTEACQCSPKLQSLPAAAGTLTSMTDQHVLTEH